MHKHHFDAHVRQCTGSRPFGAGVPGAVAANHLFVQHVTIGPGGLGVTPDVHLMLTDIYQHAGSMLNLPQIVHEYETYCEHCGLELTNNRCESIDCNGMDKIMRLENAWEKSIKDLNLDMNPNIIALSNKGFSNMRSPMETATYFLDNWEPPANGQLKDYLYDIIEVLCKNIVMIPIDTGGKLPKRYLSEGINYYTFAWGDHNQVQTYAIRYLVPDEVYAPSAWKEVKVSTDEASAKAEQITYPVEKKAEKVPPKTNVVRGTERIGGKKKKNSHPKIDMSASRRRK